MRLVLPLLLWLFCVPPVPAQTGSTSVDTQSSVLSYTGSAPLHDFTGVSHSVEGTLDLNLLDPSKSQITISVPVGSFDSGNSNRDSNMLDAVEVDRHPEVRFVSESIQPDSWAAEAQQGRWIVSGNLTFHGRTHLIEVPVDVAVNDETFQAKGTFDVSLTRFDVERPRILLMPIGDTLRMKFTIQAAMDSTRTATTSETK